MSQGTVTTASWTGGTGTGIAVIGIGCRYPDAWTPRQFWDNVDRGTVSVRQLSEQQLRSAGVPDDLIEDPAFVRAAAALPGVADFASEFFGYPPREADLIDPQHRIFLEASWEALESAGHVPQGSGPVIGVFGGSAAGNYAAALLVQRAGESGLHSALSDLELTLGGQADYLTSRVAYKLGLRGPAVSLQTACSSSLYAVHYAALSLQAGECDIALAGGASIVEPLCGYRYEPGGILSADGRCRPFDARSSGTAYSSGVGVVALRRLPDALADGDPVLAVIRGSAVGNDGGEQLGFVAPSPGGIAEVVGGALRAADVPAGLLRYVEAHGSGTALGDHIELLALTRALRAFTGERGSCGPGSCGLGSVKANIGHTGAAAGISGLIKAVHVVRTGRLPPHPGFERPRDPDLLGDSPFFVATRARECPDADRHVLVNSMGAGGTNAAAVLAPPPEPVRARAPDRPVVRLLLSARTGAELDALSCRLADALDEGVAAPDAAHTLRMGRAAFAERRVVSAPPEKLAAALRLPRSPDVRTVRSSACRPLLVVPATWPGPSAAALVDGLLAALPGARGTVTGPLHDVPRGSFALFIGHGAVGPDRHMVPLPAEPGGCDGSLDEVLDEVLDEAAAAAWLHGVEVRWEALAAGQGRRVALPTYPFTRRRHWALDRLGSTSVPRTATPTSRAASAADCGDCLEQQLTALWQEQFGLDAIGPDDEFGALGGTSLLFVRMAVRLQEDHGVLLDIRRAGGSRATIRSIAATVRELKRGADTPPLAPPPCADGGHGSAEPGPPLPEPAAAGGDSHGKGSR